MNLEIRVYDTITTCDTLVQAEQAIVEIVRKWFNSNDEKPLTITVSKVQNNSPPVLKINVNDSVSAKGTMA